MDVSLQRAWELLAGVSLPAPTSESVPLAEAADRVVAEAIHADRDLPAFPRSMRDGYAVRAEDVHPSGTLPCVGMVRAGQAPPSGLLPGTCVEIMTGAAVPAGADAVVMVEKTRRDGDQVHFLAAITSGENLSARGSEARQHSQLLAPGLPLSPAAIALLASVGVTRPLVFRRPRVVVVSTGDELVTPEQTPEPFQIRNSNALALAAWVARAGGVPHIAPICRDEPTGLREQLGTASEQADLLLVTGGVSAGRFDFVESVLSEMGASFLFQSVHIRPGRPVVLASLPRPGGLLPVLALPGNPLSAALTFALFGRFLVARLTGHPSPPLAAFRSAVLAEPWTGKPLDLERFLPARWVAPDPSAPLGAAAVAPVLFQGSADLAALARAQLWLHVPAGLPSLPAGQPALVLEL